MSAPVSGSLGRGSAGVVAALLPGTTPARTVAGRRRQLEALGELRPDAAWLVLAAMGPGLPTAPEVEELVRRARVDGIRAALAGVRRRPGRAPEVVTGVVLVDVQDTATTRIATGVQRVAREVAVRWSARAGVELVGWTASRRRLVRLDAAGVRAGRRTRLARGAVVPWRATYLLPETLNENARSLRIHALAASGANRTGMVGHDTVPLTTAETAGPGMPGAFAKYLAAAGRMDVVAATSTASATEFSGWKRMLPSAGIAGPEIVTVPLPVTPLAAPAEAEAAARALLGIRDDRDGIPIVLCVGSHEPRKNHRAVLHAAELCRRRGDVFRLVFVGGAGWGADGSVAAIEAARAAGHDVLQLSGVPDAELAWAYRLARVTAFPSLNEGFGLPVAESLAAGTPVITSAFGSTAELGARGGILVDPRDERALADALHLVLTDDATLARLRVEAGVDTARGWDEYAAELFAALAPAATGSALDAPSGHAAEQSPRMNPRD